MVIHKIRQMKHPLEKNSSYYGMVLWMLQVTNEKQLIHAHEMSMTTKRSQTLMKICESTCRQGWYDL